MSRPLCALEIAKGSDRVADLAGRLAGVHSLEDRIVIACGFVPGPVAFSTSLGLEDQVLLHGIAQSGAAVDVFTLDTGRHFPETLETLERSERRYGIRIRLVAPVADELEQLVARDGVFGFRLSVEGRKACCDVRKVRPLRRALEGAAAWLTGLRRGQSATRARVPLAEWDAGVGLIKLNLIADWTLERVKAYLTEHEIPINPLHTRGFPSIGCQPCTRAIRPGEDSRAGRWWWENDDGKECGLHNGRAVSTEASA
jgi:phosphoadenosine phosphosulfate reductase